MSASGPPLRQPGNAHLGPPLNGRDVIRTLLIAFGAYFAIMLTLATLVDESSSATERLNATIAGYAAWTLASLGAIWIVFVRRRGMTLADLGYVAPEPRWALIGVLGGFLALPVAFMLLLLLQPMLGAERGPDVRQALGGDDFTVVHAATLLLYVGILVPITEELLFRGLIFRWLRGRLDFAAAAVVSSVVFGLAHQRPVQVVVTTVLGFALAWLYERSRSLVPAILLHQTYNTINLMLTFSVVWIAPAEM